MLFVLFSYMVTTITLNTHVVISAGENCRFTCHMQNIDVDQLIEALIIIISITGRISVCLFLFDPAEKCTKIRSFLAFAIPGRSSFKLIYKWHHVTHTIPTYVTRYMLTTSSRP